MLWPSTGGLLTIRGLFLSLRGVSPRLGIARATMVAKGSLWQAVAKVQMHLMRSVLQ